MGWRVGPGGRLTPTPFEADEARLVSLGHRVWPLCGRTEEREQDEDDLELDLDEVWRDADGGEG